MPLTVQILPIHNLVYVRYSGIARVEETMRAFAEYVQHPDFRPAQKQLVDLAEVTGFEADYVDLIKLQARKAEAFYDGIHETLMAYYAPNDEALRLARLAMNSWDATSGVVVCVTQHEDEALAMLGLGAARIEELLQSA